MDSDNPNMVWMDVLEAEVDNRVIQYLTSNSGEYRNLQNQMRDLMKNASGVKELLDDGKEIQLSEQEHQVYQEYRRLRSEMDALERKHFYLAGQISVMEDLR